MRSLIKFYFLAWPLVCAFFVLFFFFGQHSRRTVVINICICLDCINLLNLHHVAESIYGPMGRIVQLYICSKRVYMIDIPTYMCPRTCPRVYDRVLFVCPRLFVCFFSPLFAYLANSFACCSEECSGCPPL